MTPKSPNHVQRQLTAYLDGELPASAARAVAAHCADCASCAQALAGERALREVLAGNEAREPLRPMWPAVRRRLRSRPEPRWRWAFAMGTAGVAALGVALGVSIGAWQRAGSSTERDVLASVGESTFSEIYFDVNGSVP